MGFHAMEFGQEGVHPVLAQLPLAAVAVEPGILPNRPLFFAEPLAIPIVLGTRRRGGVARGHDQIVRDAGHGIDGVDALNVRRIKFMVRIEGGFRRASWRVG